VTQRTIDFNLAVVFRAVESLKLDGTTTAVFKAILSCGRSAWPSVAELARRTGYSGRTVRRATRRLERRGLLGVQRRRRPDGSYTSNVYQPTGALFGAVNGSAHAASPSGGGTDKPAGGYCQADRSHHKPMQPKNKTHEHGPAPAAVVSRRRINWRRTITAADLSDPATVEELFGIACASRPTLWRNVPPDRDTFHGLAAIATLKENPGGWFSAAVAGKWTRFVTQAIEDRAHASAKLAAYE